MVEWIDYRSVQKLHRRESGSYMEFPIGWQVSLSDFERDALERECRVMSANPYLSGEIEGFVQGAKQAFESCIHPSTKAKLDSIMWHGSGLACLSNLPVDKCLPPTPSVGGFLSPAVKDTFVSETVGLGLGALLGGELFNFRQEGRGTAPLIDNIVPMAAYRNQKGAGGYKNNFPFHTESAWHRKRPDFLILTGLREAEAAKTLVFSASQLNDTRFLKSRLTEYSTFRLRAPELYLQMEQDGMPLGTPKFCFRPPIEIVESKSERYVRLNLNFNGMDCVDQDALNLLGQLEKFIELNAYEFVLAPGTALILNNQNTCHTRSGYVPKFDGGQRWFQRCYFHKSLWTPKCDLYGKDNFNILLREGWITKDHQLTQKAIACLEDGSKNLSPQTASLAKLALSLGPAPGSRII